MEYKVSELISILQYLYFVIFSLCLIYSIMCYLFHISYYVLLSVIIYIVSLYVLHILRCIV